MQQQPVSIFQLISTASVFVFVAFGIINIRLFMASRKREASLALLNSFQTPDFVRGLWHVLQMRPGLSRSEIEGLPFDQFLSIYMVIGTWERLGILVYRREIPLDLVDDAYSGPIVISWKKLERYIQDFRQWVGRETGFEWFQWLAERMMDREAKGDPVPAYVAHRDWKAE